MSAGSAPRQRYRALEHFEVLGELGQGAASRILHIRDSESYQHFAMKVVIRRGADEEKYLDQAKHEYEVAQKFDHPSLLKVYDVRVIRRWFREREVRSLLEYINGETLEQIKQPSLPLLAVVFGEVADSVAHMHRCGVFHADLKPNNIMVSRSGQVKVIDFGLAWYRGDRKGRVQGTVGYLAPEQMRDRIVNEATDIFNFGATMYRMLSGRLPTGPITSGGGANFMSTRAMVTPIEELRQGIPPQWSVLVNRCCENKPQKRPPRMSDVCSTLREVAKGLSVTVDDVPALLRQR